MKLVRKLTNWFFNKRVLPYWAVLLTDTFIVFFASVFTYWIIHRSFVTYEHRCLVFYNSLLFALLSWIGARKFKTYSGVLRYSSSYDLLRMAHANLVTFCLALLCTWICRLCNITIFTAFTFTGIFSIFLIATMLMWALRIMAKMMFELAYEREPATRVLIFGALKGGIILAKYVRSMRPAKYELKGFISHASYVKDRYVLGVPVYSIEDDLVSIIQKRKIQAVLVSPLRVKEFQNNQALQDLFIGAGCKIFMVQPAKESSIESGELSQEELEGMQLHEVSVEELLPREEIKIDLKAVEKQLKGQRVLITGAAGSIGAEIVRQVAQFGPASMMLIDQAETPQHDITLMMSKDYPNVPCEVVVTSICHKHRMENVFDRFRPDYVFHAAAYKHVPMMEDNPSEAVLNNVYGTKIVADLSVKYGVKKFVMISTDKAVNPTNVMGCSKRICEIYCQSLNKFLDDNTNGNGERCHFVTTRFGNVLGSNGSVIPIFREQIKNGGPVTVTDERIVRFFMLIPEACKLVLEAGTMGHGGEIFVFDMGKPVRIVDLAKRMISLSGAKNIKIEFTGLREGEKLYEEVLNEMEGTMPTFHDKIRIASVREYDYEAVNRDIEDLLEISRRYDNMDIVRKMKEMVPEYKSNNSVYSVLDEVH
ncbi:MAG: polysaccharide biosynthesis protein [Bacteroidaceae bacterium]|nr:polysaccharide biosynthesis protein [Bacteroidaceae bacterium]